MVVRDRPRRDRHGPTAHRRHGTGIRRARQRLDRDPRRHRRTRRDARRDPLRRRRWRPRDCALAHQLPAQRGRDHRPRRRRRARVRAQHVEPIRLLLRLRRRGALGRHPPLGRGRVDRGAAAGSIGSHRGRRHGRGPRRRAGRGRPLAAGRRAGRVDGAPCARRGRRALAVDPREPERGAAARARGLARPATAHQRPRRRVRRRARPDARTHARGRIRPRRPARRRHRRGDRSRDDGRHDPRLHGAGARPAPRRRVDPRRASPRARPRRPRRAGPAARDGCPRGRARPE